MAQIPMYAADIQSTETVLTAGIDAVTTTITVFDASGLLPAPNILTIREEVSTDDLDLTPQIYARERVEVAGSERLPIKQIPFTNELSVQDVPGNVMREKLYVQSTLFMQAMMDAGNIPYPQGWDLIK